MPSPSCRAVLTATALLAGATMPAAAQPAQSDSATGPSAAPERVTGPVSVEQPPRSPRSLIIERPGAPPVVVSRDRVLEVSGANLVVVDETPRGTRLTVQNDVLFDFDRAELKPEAEAALKRVAALIRDRHPRAAVIVGHTDAVGSDGYNRTLSERRARAVEQWLAKEGGTGLPPLRTEGRGEREPVAPNEVDGKDNSEGRQRNRRVEVLLER